MSSLPHIRSRSVLVCALYAAFLSACASSGGSVGSGEKIRVSLRDYRGDMVFELAGESHTDRIEYYSKVRASASRKVVSDRIANALTRELDGQGFKRNRKPGRAPSQGGSILSWGLEVERDGNVDHWVIGPGSDVKEQRAFQGSRKVFLELYNSTFSFQTVNNDRGKGLFEKGIPLPAGRRQ